MLFRLLIIIAIVLVGVAAFSHLNPSAQKSLQPLLDGLNTVKSWFNNKISDIRKSGQTNDQTSGTTVYKWKDREGNWQFSNQPPPEDVASSVTVYHTDTNVTQAQKPPPLPSEESTTPTNNAVPATPAPLLPYTNPERVKQLMDDAKNVQNIMDQRQQAIEQGENGR